jgi:phage FluMu protein Com
MIKVLEKSTKQKEIVKKAICPRCKRVNRFIADNDLVLFCKKCGQLLGLSIFY